MAVIGSIIIGMMVDSKKLKAGLDEGGSMLHAFGETLGGIGEVVAEVFAAEKVFEWVKGTIEAAGAAIHLADRLGTTVENMKELEYVAKLTGSDMGTVETSMQKLSQNLGDASHGSTDAGRAIERLGLKAKDLADMDPAVALEEVIKKFGQLPSQAERASVAMDIFGKGGRNMIGTLKLGAKGLEELKAGSAGLKVGFEGVNGEELGKANEAIERLSLAFEGISTLLVSKLAPGVTSVLDLMSGWLKDATVDGTMLTDAFSAMGTAIKGVGWAFNIPIRMAHDFWAAFDRATTEKRDTRVDMLPKGPKLDKTDAFEEAAGKARAANNGPEKFATIKAGADLEKKLRDEINATSLSWDPDREKLMAIWTKDLSINQVEVIANLLKTRDAEKDLADTRKTMKADALGFYEDSKTEGEKEIDRQQKLNMLYKDGNIGKAVFDRAGNKPDADKAKKIREDMMTPLEAYEKKLKDLEKLAKSGNLTPQEFLKASDKAMGETVGLDKPKFASMAEMGSKEAYSAVMNFRSDGASNDPTKKLIKSSEQAVDYQRQMLAELKKPQGATVAAFS